MRIWEVRKLKGGFSKSCRKVLCFLVSFIFSFQMILGAEVVPSAHSVAEERPFKSTSVSESGDPVLGNIPTPQSAKVSTDFLRLLKPLSSAFNNSQALTSRSIAKKSTVPTSPLASSAEDRVTKTITLDPEAFVAGTKYGADSLSPDWTNSSGKVVRPNESSNQLTSKLVNYFQPDNIEEFAIKSKSASRDSEIDTHRRRGQVFNLQLKT